MAFKTVLLCVFAFLAQSISGQPCHQPWPAPPCGCSSDGISIYLSEDCGQSYYQPLPILGPSPAPVPLPRPIQSSCGCNSDSISINLSGGRGQSCNQPLPWPAPAPLPLPRPLPPSCGCNSESISISVSEGAQSHYRPQPLPLHASCNSNRVSIGTSESGSGSYYQSAVGAPSCVSIAVPNSGGAFAITSTGPIAPSGIAVATDVGLAGDLYLSGVLPYLSAVGFEGQFATSGSAPVSYGCGNGCIAISEEIGGYAKGGAGSINVNVVGGGSGGCGCGCH